MRYAKDQKRKTRTRILRAAAQRFREKGFRGAGVDDVMSAVGLTAGGFYAHFESKEALLSEVLALSLRETRDRLLGGLDNETGTPWLREVVRRYLSRAHRDAPADGCALPTLSAEVARMSGDARATFEDHLRALLAEVEEKAPRSASLDPGDRALAVLALFAGALMLSRAVSDRALSDRILLASRRLALAELAESTPAPSEKKT